MPQFTILGYMKQTIQKFSVDKNGNKKTATGTVNLIKSEASFGCENNLTIEVEGTSDSGRHYSTTMTLKATNSENAVNDRVNKLPDWAKNQLFGFGINLYKKPKKRRYGIEIDGQHFFVIETVDDLKKLCNFINS